MFPSSLYPVITAFFAFMVAQGLKVPFFYYQTGKWEPKLVTTSHALFFHASGYEPFQQ